MRVGGTGSDAGAGGAHQREDEPDDTDRCHDQTDGRVGEGGDQDSDDDDDEWDEDDDDWDDEDDDEWEEEESWDDEGGSDEF